MPVPTLGSDGVVLDLVFSHINDKKSLYRCCLVSQAFNRVASSKLWKHLYFDNRNKHCLSDPDRRASLFQSTNLENTRVLIHKGKGAKSDDHRHFPGLEPDDVETNLTMLIERLTNLTSVSLQNFHLSYPVLASLSEAPQLESLSLVMAPDAQLRPMLSSGIFDPPPEFHEIPCEGEEGEDDEEKAGDEDDENDEDDEDDEEEGTSAMTGLPIFRNLKQLTVLGMFGELVNWHEWLSAVLLESDDLTHLSLSIDDATDGMYQAKPNAITSHGFFEDVCHAFEKKAEKRLRLKSLRLGNPIQFPGLATLSMLTDCSALEDIYVCTGTSGQFSASQQYAIPFEILSENVTPSLRRLFMSHITKSLLERQNDVFVSSIRSLSTFGFSSWGNPSVQKIAKAQLRNLAGNISCLTVGDNSDGRGSLHAPPASIQILACLRDIASIQQLSVTVDSRCLEWSTLKAGRQFPQFCKHLGTIENLQTLWMMGKAPFEPHASLVDAQKGNMLLVLRKLTDYCPSLIYIKIGKFAWQLVDTDPGSDGHFEALGEWEDETVCPQSLYTPAPLPGGSVSGHSDWRLINWRDSI